MGVTRHTILYSKQNFQDPLRPLRGHPLKPTGLQILFFPPAFQQGHHHGNKTFYLNTQQNGPSNSIRFTIGCAFTTIVCHFEHLSTVAMHDVFGKMAYPWQLEILVD
jgi:hypothetical protein